MSVGNVSDRGVNPVIQARVDFALKYLMNGCDLSIEQMAAIQNILSIVPSNTTQAPIQMREGSVSVLSGETLFESDMSEEAIEIEVLGKNSLKRSLEDPEEPSPKRIKTSPSVPSGRAQLGTFNLEQYGPFPIFELFQYASKYLQKAQIGRMARVCQLWNHFSKDQSIWKLMTINEGVPLVKSKKQRDYRAYLKLIGPLTISGKMIGECLGELVEEIPRISKRWFHNLSKPYCFFGGNYSLQVRTALVVIPGYLKRTFSNTFPFGLDDRGNLIPSDQCLNLVDGQELIIPLTRRNLELLCSSPLIDNKNLSLVSNSLVTCPNLVRDSLGPYPNLDSKIELNLLVTSVYPSSPITKMWSWSEYSLISSYSGQTSIPIVETPILRYASSDEESDDDYCVETSISSDEESDDPF